MASLSKADYLKKYLSGADDEKKRKKKRKEKEKYSKNSGMKIVEDEAFITVKTEAKSDDSEDEEEIRMIEELKKKALRGPRFKKTFMTTENDDEIKEIKQEPLSDDEGVSFQIKSKENRPEIKEEVNSNGRVSRASDCSPPRRRRHDSDGDSPPRRRKRYDSDASPPRGRENRSPPRRTRHDSDASPPRRNDSKRDRSPPRRARHDSDASPQRKGNDRSSPRRKRYDSDESPPRKHTSSNRDKSPPRRTRHDSDASPPRRSNNRSPPQRRRHDSDESPPRRNDNRNSSRNKSPPRRTRHDSDNSPVRRNRYDSDESPKRKRHRQDSDSSPPRGNKRNTDRDQSPPRREIKTDPDAPPTRRRIASPEIDKQAKTLDGKVAGLQSAKDLRKESEKLREKEKLMFDEMDVATSGRDAATVHRDKQVRKGKDNPEDKEKKEREQRKQRELEEIYKNSWNKGVHQVQERKDKLQEMARVAQEPLARPADDAAMNKYLQHLVHEEDPMKKVIRQNRTTKAIDMGELVYPTYDKPFPPNRFGIRPGYRWDGVDRSNGFETKLYISKNQKQSDNTSYYQNLGLYE